MWLYLSSLLENSRSKPSSQLDAFFIIPFWSTAFLFCRAYFQSLECSLFCGYWGKYLWEYLVWVNGPHDNDWKIHLPGVISLEFFQYLLIEPTEKVSLLLPRWVVTYLFLEINSFNMIFHTNLVYFLRTAVTSNYTVILFLQL